MISICAAGATPRTWYRCAIAVLLTDELGVLQPGEQRSPPAARDRRTTTGRARSRLGSGSKTPVTGFDSQTVSSIAIAPSLVLSDPSTSTVSTASAEAGAANRPSTDSSASDSNVSMYTGAPERASVNRTLVTSPIACADAARIAADLGRQRITLGLVATPRNPPTETGETGADQHDAGSHLRPMAGLIASSRRAGVG